MAMSQSAVGTAVSDQDGLVSLDYPEGLPVLVVDDEADVRNVIVRCLRKFKVPTVEAENLGDARARFDAGEQFSMVFLDKCLPDGDGVEFSREILEARPDLSVVIVTGRGSGDEANKAIESGVFRYIPKPCYISDIRDALVRRFPKLTDVTDEGAATGIPVGGLNTDREKRSGVTLIAHSSVMIRVSLDIRDIAKMTRPVFLTGRSGTGKEVIARSIHEMSERSGRKFVAVNCGAMPQELIESALFGHVKGAFTGATMDRKGIFEDADGGTVFLDEITETTAAFQVKLLRVLQEHCITRVGSNQEIKLDVRVIASSNRNVLDEVAGGRFREDLYFRLKGSEIFLPPLKDRRDDIIPLALHFAGMTADKIERKISVSMGVLEALKGYEWPGNVRELESCMDSAVQRCNGMVLLSDLPRDMRIVVGDLHGDEGPVVGTPEEVLSVKELADAHILQVLRQCNGNQSKAAKLLHIDRTELGRKIKRNNWEVKPSTSTA